MFNLSGLRSALGLGDTQGAHPLATPEKVDALIADLPRDDALVCVTRVTEWLEDLNAMADFSFQRRVPVVARIDDVAGIDWCRALVQVQPASDKANATNERAQVVLRGLLAYVNALTAAYKCCADSTPAEVAPELAAGYLARWMGALGRRTGMRRGLSLAPQPGEWLEINSVYRRAVASNAERVRVQLSARPPVHTSVRQEYLTVLLYDMLNPGSLRLRQMTPAYRLAMRCGRFAQLAEAKTGGAKSFVALAEDRGPRSLHIEAPSGALYIDTSQCAAHVSEMVQSKYIKPDQFAAEFGTGYTAVELNRLLQHALNWWGNQPRSQRRDRTPLTAPVRVLTGLDVIFAAAAALDQGDFKPGADVQGNPSVNSAAPQPGRPGTAATCLNVSASGIGLAVPAHLGRRMKVGQLAAVEIAIEGHPKLAVVRRIEPINDASTNLGLEILSARPRSAWADITFQPSADVWVGVRSSGQTLESHFLKVLLLQDAPKGSNAPMPLVMPARRCVAGMKLDIPVAMGIMHVRIVDVQAGGEEHALANTSMVFEPRKSATAGEPA